MAYPNTVAPPTGSGDALAAMLRNQAGYQRKFNQAPIDANFQRNQLANSRELFLNRLGTQFHDQTRDMHRNYAARGLAHSGIHNEGGAEMARDQLAKRTDYELDYNNSLNNINLNQANNQWGIVDNRSTSRDQYNEMLARQAEELRLAGYSAL